MKLKVSSLLAFAVIGASAQSSQVPGESASVIPSDPLEGVTLAGIISFSELSNAGTGGNTFSGGDSNPVEEESTAPDGMDFPDPTLAELTDTFVPVPKSPTAAMSTTSSVSTPSAQASPAVVTEPSAPGQDIALNAVPVSVPSNTGTGGNTFSGGDSNPVEEESTAPDGMDFPDPTLAELTDTFVPVPKSPTAAMSTTSSVSTPSAQASPAVVTEPSAPGQDPVVNSASVSKPPNNAQAPSKNTPVSPADATTASSTTSQSTRQSSSGGSVPVTTFSATASTTGVNIPSFRVGDTRQPTEDSEPDAEEPILSEFISGSTSSSSARNRGAAAAGSTSEPSGEESKTKNIAVGGSSSGGSPNHRVSDPRSSSYSASSRGNDYTIEIDSKPGDNSESASGSNAATDSQARSSGKLDDSTSGSIGSAQFWASAAPIAATVVAFALM